jgi:hypothetical protein
MDLNELKKLAGINEFKGYQEYSLNTGSDIAAQNRKTESENNIQPGTKEWFNLWFNQSTPQLNMPQGFRSRKK